MRFTPIALTPLLTVVLTLLMTIAVAATPFRSGHGYVITPPTGWTVETSGALGTDVIFHAPPLHGFSAMINAVIGKAPPGATIDNTLAHVNKVYPQLFKGYKPVAQRSATLDGAKAFANLANYQAGTPPRLLRMQQVAALKNGQLYIFTCTCLAADYSHSSAAFNAALKSIRWTK